jgi:pseudo-rSAM protein
VVLKLGSIILLNFMTSTQFSLIIEVDELINENELSYLDSLIKEKQINAGWKFFVKSSLDFERVERICSELCLNNHEVKPVVTCDNLDFFHENVFLEKADLLNPKLCRREVFAHQALNTNDFGKLTIMTDGKVFANPYFPALGTIEDDIRELIYRELTEGKSWLRIRNMEPCCKCVFQWLCPSPSDYELAIGKPNLCHIKP